MNQHYSEKFLQSVVDEVEKQQGRLNGYHNDMPNHARLCMLNGMREVIRLWATQDGRTMDEGETIAEYFKRWLSRSYSLQDVDQVMRELRDGVDRSDTK
jgi:hypothetical protein